MPIYEYTCQNCGDDFECIVFRTDEPVECPKCGNKQPTKKMSSFGFSVGHALQIVIERQGQAAPAARRLTALPVRRESMDLEGAVRRVIEQEGLIDGGDVVLVGVSGGVDSSALLFLLKRLAADMGFGLAVAHVNHQLRGEESAADEAFVKDLAARMGLPCHTARARREGVCPEQGPLSAARGQGPAVRVLR